MAHCPTRPILYKFLTLDLTYHRVLYNIRMHIIRVAVYTVTVGTYITCV